MEPTTFDLSLVTESHVPKYTPQDGWGPPLIRQQVPVARGMSKGLEKLPFCPSSREANIRRYKKILENPPEPEMPRLAHVMTLHSQTVVPRP